MQGKTKYPTAKLVNVISVRYRALTNKKIVVPTAKRGERGNYV